jgi:hypothetical protein
VPPTPVRLTRRALEGGPAVPSKVFSVITQGHTVTSGRRDQSSPSLSALCGPPPPLPHHAGHYDDIPTLLGHTGTRRPPDRHCAAYGPPVNDTLESAHYGGQSTNHYTTTLEAAPVRAQDAPRRLNRSRIRQDGRQLRGTARHASTRREIVRHACKLFPPWPIKGGAAPQPQDRGRQTAIIHTLSAFSTILALSSINTSGTWRPGLLSHHACSPPLRAPRCEAIQCPEHTIAGRTAPAGTRINPSVISC